MENMKYDLYLDESGNFEEDDRKKKKTPSLVGGILCPSHVMTQRKIDSLITKPIHASEGYDKEHYFSIIGSLLKLGGKIILFENPERVHILDGDTTYLNIITEGLTKLLRDLHNRYPHANLEINILIATRQNSEERENGNQIRIMEIEYKKRFDEKMFISLGRNKIEHVEFKFSFANAKKDKRLMFADLICNTWLTRKGKVKFSAEDRDKISSLYADSVHYEVYEDPDAGYLRRLISENRIGEAIAQLCTHKKAKQNVLDVRDLLINRIIKEYTEDRETYFSYMSLKLGQLNRRRDRLTGIQVAERYKELILEPLTKNEEVRQTAEYWQFDTDFYLLTMYDHIGNVDKCTEYAELCNKHIGVVSRSWEHIDYYFKFRIRELNQMIGCFDFENVLLKSQPLIDVLQSAKELFSMITPDTEGSNTQGSDLLGKVYGVRLEAYTNLLYDHPEFYSQALTTSDLALAEFSRSCDIQRQLQYRCLLQVTANKSSEALISLLKAYNLEDDNTPFSRFIEKAFSNGMRADVFALFHYSNVMVLLKQNNDSQAEKMYKAIMADPRFVHEIQMPTEDDYPWNLILWNLGRYLRIERRSKKMADEYITRALNLTSKHTEKATMFSFCVGIAADRVAWAMQKDQSSVDEQKKSFNQIYMRFQGMRLPDTMRRWFECSKASVDDYIHIAHRTLK